VDSITALTKTLIGPYLPPLGRDRAGETNPPVPRKRPRKGPPRENMGEVRGAGREGEDWEVPGGKWARVKSPSPVTLSGYICVKPRVNAHSSRKWCADPTLAFSAPSF